MSKRAQKDQQISVAADPKQWSEQSKRSVAYHFKREYVDEPYKCSRCSVACTFTAQDQKYTFEIKKASKDQRRKFCSTCWSESNRMRATLSEYDLRWTAEKSSLRANREFLTEWLELFMRWKQFAPYKHDIAKIAMVRCLLKLG
ncbi:zinc-ribbon domain containing protein [Massilia rubra]|nr:zinc-ribbon domain containing protein [Massilia rubra]